MSKSISGKPVKIVTDEERAVVSVGGLRYREAVAPGGDADGQRDESKVEDRPAASAADANG